MIRAQSLINVLKKNNCKFFTGVPDSVLKEFSRLLPRKNKKKHIIATNEGSAVAIGIGHYLSTKKMPVIYMQNSGISNALNPLISLAHKQVYSIPLVLVIGWRGSPDIKDEPQHMVKGKITKQILKLLNIKYIIVNSKNDLIKFDKQIKLAKKKKTILACLIKRGVLEKNRKKILKKDYFKLNKEYFLKTLLENIPAKSKIISSTGFNSRELLYLKDKYKFHKYDYFYLVGGMGHTSSVALGYSLSSRKKIICIDGDGSMLMHLGSIKTVGSLANKNFKYILLNNNTHDSVGGQCTYSKNINFEKLSNSLGFKKFFSIKEKFNLKKKIKRFINYKNCCFLEVKIGSSKIKKLPRPKNLIKIKQEFMK